MSNSAMSDDPPGPASSESERKRERARAMTEFFRQRSARIENPSPRVPTMSRDFNPADQMELQLRGDGHDKWGFVIYRTTYDSDDDWAEFLRRMRLRMEKNFDFLNGRDILEQHELTVFDDRATFENATTDSIRRHFQEWSLTAFSKEQPPSVGRHAKMGNSPRYHYAMLVDKAALLACVHEAPDPEEPSLNRGWVKLIDKTWYLGRGVMDSQQSEALEGVTTFDVGWVKVSLVTVVPDEYSGLWKRSAWSTFYQRPPEIIGSRLS